MYFQAFYYINNMKISDHISLRIYFIFLCDCCDQRYLTLSKLWDAIVVIFGLFVVKLQAQDYSFRLLPVKRHMIAVLMFDVCKYKKALAIYTL